MSAQNEVLRTTREAPLSRGNYWLNQFTELFNQEKREISPGVRRIYELIESELTYCIEQRNISHLYALPKDEQFQKWIIENLKHSDETIEPTHVANTPDRESQYPRIEAEFQDFLEMTIGANGYVRQYHMDRGQELSFGKDAATLVIALIVSVYGHHKQFRGTGEPYILHPGFVAKHAGFFHKLPVRDLVTAWCHDLLEDSAKPRKYNNEAGEVIEEKGYPVNKSNLSALFGQVAKDVDGLTYVRKAHKIDGKVAKDPYATQLKIIEGTLHRPPLIVIKIYDQLHNAMTLEGKKNEADRIAIASTMLRVYVPLARLFGLHFEADILEDICWPYVDEATFRDGFSESVSDVLSHFRQQMRVETPDMIRANISEYFNEDTFSEEEYGIEVRFPYAFEVAKDIASRKVDKNSMYMDLTLVLPPSKQFGTHAMSALQDLINMQEMTVPADGNIGADSVLANMKNKATTSQKLVQEGVFRLIFDNGSTQVPVRVHIVDRENYMMMRTPISNLVALDLLYMDLEHWAQLTTDQRKLWANRRLSQLQKSYHDCIDSGLETKETVEFFLESTGDGIIVYGSRTREGKSEVYATPLAQGMTVADYMCMKLGDRNGKYRMTWVRSVSINGEIFEGAGIDEIINRELKNGDKIHCDYVKKERPEHMSVKWLDSLTIKNADMRKGLSTHVWRIIKEGHDKRGMAQELMKRGLEQFESIVQGTRIVGLQALEDLFPVEVTTPQELAIKLALGLVEGEELNQMVERMSVLVQKLECWTLTKSGGDEVGLIADITKIAKNLGLPYETFCADKPFGEASIEFYVFPGYQWHTFEQVLSASGWDINKGKPVF